MERITHLKLKSPYNMLISGQTGCGKTQFVFELLKNLEELHETTFERIVYAYNMQQSIYTDMLNVKANIEFTKGMPENLNLDGRPSLLILDDMMCDLAHNKNAARMFTTLRHENLSIIFLVQNLYFRSPQATTITRNCHYLVLFPNLRDSSLIATIGRQIFPDKKNFIYESFKLATAEPYGYLFLDLKTDTPEYLRVRSSIFPQNELVVYAPSS